MANILVNPDMLITHNRSVFLPLHLILHIAYNLRETIGEKSKVI